MVKERINVLVGKDDEHAHELGKQLMRSGAEVSYTRGNVLNIQYDVINKKPDALILSSLTRYKNELCKVLKKTEIMPMIIVINEGQGEGNEREYADLIVDKLDRGIYGKLYSRLFGISETRTYDDHRGSEMYLDHVIADALFELCITKNYNGYLYVLEAIKLASNTGLVSRGISKEIYPAIASKFRVTPCCVERNIRTVIRSSWAKSGKEIKREYFGPFTLDESWVPTNSEFIFIVADRLALRMGGHI